ncbi:Gfo/Idh/MocA family oxidoreductase, partial [Bacillus cereus]|nr:Gfo/Idh/MocA family oxidoreductase [Bacillus cereus]
KVGIIGCGKISGIYMENCHRFDILELYAVADLDQGRAEEQAVAFNVPNVYSVDEILADPEIELIINLTIPGVHADVCLRALEAGKHV